MTRKPLFKELKLGSPIISTTAYTLVAAAAPSVRCRRRQAAARPMGVGLAMEKGTTQHPHHGHHVVSTPLVVGL